MPSRQRQGDEAVTVSRQAGRVHSAVVGPDTEQPGDLVREVEQGRSERTPVLALTGVTLAVAALVGVVLVIVVAVYLLA